MDPSAMDFVMHRSADRMAMDQQHLSPCPALRAAAVAEQGQYGNMHPVSHGRSSSGGSGVSSQFDPVYSYWSSQYHQQANPPNGWQHQHYQPFVRSVPPMYAPHFSVLPAGLGSNAPQSGPGSQSRYSGMNGPENYGPHTHSTTRAYSPPPLHRHQAVPSLNRIGDAAPVQHSQGAALSAVLGDPDSPTPRAATLATLNSPPTQSPLRTSARSSDDSGIMEGVSSTGIESTSEGSRRATEAQSSRTATRSSVSAIPPHLRAAGIEASGVYSYQTNRMPSFGRDTGSDQMTETGSSEGSGDEDADMDDSDPTAARMLERAFAAGLPPTFMGLDPEDRIRFQQLLRGSATGKRVASRSAIASLQCVRISDLPEGERTCIICYNDFGVANPEGINEAPLRLPKCKHVFGDHCIKKWFEESDSCPYCRDKVPSEPAYRAHSSQAVVQFMRQQQVQIQQRRSGAEPSRLGSYRNANEPGYGYGYGFDLYNHLPRPIYRGESSSAANSRPPAWHGSPERRSPPTEYNEGRRRTRPRHGSLRGSPPSSRSNPYGASTLQTQNPLPTPGFRQYYGHGHRHSVAFGNSPPPPRPRPSDAPSFEPDISAPFQPTMGNPREQFLNPLNTGSMSANSENFMAGWGRDPSNYMSPRPVSQGASNVPAPFPGSSGSDQITSQPSS